MHLASLATSSDARACRRSVTPRWTQRVPIPIKGTRNSGPSFLLLTNPQSASCCFFFSLFQRVNDPLFYFLTESFTGRRENDRSSRKPNSRLLLSQPKRTCLLQVRKVFTHSLAKENRLVTAAAYLFNDSAGFSASPFILWKSVLLFFYSRTN